jgi:PAS domain S-box-containing protein
VLDLAAAPSAAPWRAVVAQYGWVAAGSLPLRCEGHAIGALTIYANSVDAFDEDSRRLLLEMATSVSSALDNMARERRRAANEEALRESESRYRALFADTDVPRLVLDPDTGRIVDANAAAADFYGYPLSQLTKMHIGDINTLGADAIRVKLAKARTGEQRSFDFQHRLAGGDVRDVQVFSTSISLNGETLLLSTVFDVTESRRAAAVLRAALQERDALLKEVHHRVKNNLQVISSLLRLERERHLDTTVTSAIGEMQLRILSMALLHETLYRSNDLARVDLAAYLAELAGQVFRSSAPPSGAIKLRTNLTSVLVDIDHAVPCGLLVNEILSNCLKHGFPNGRAGTVTIDLQPAGGGAAYLLRISDTGVGLPADFESRQKTSLGVHLIRVLARQLKASLAIDGRDGTTFSIAFAPSTFSSEEARS